MSYSVPDGTSNGHRATYADAGQAMRQSITRALQAPDLTFSDTKVLLVVLAETGTWSRLSEAITRQQIAEKAGVSEATAKRSLARLDAMNAIDWHPVRGRGKQCSRVVLPRSNGSPGRPVTPVEEPVENPSNGSLEDPFHQPAQTEKWVIQMTREMGHPDDPPYEKHEKKEEEPPVVPHDIIEGTVVELEPIQTADNLATGYVQAMRDEHQLGFDQRKCRKIIQDQLDAGCAPIRLARLLSLLVRDGKPLTPGTLAYVAKDRMPAGSSVSGGQVGYRADTGAEGGRYLAWGGSTTSQRVAQGMDIAAKFAVEEGYITADQAQSQASLWWTAQPEG